MLPFPAAFSQKGASRLMRRMQLSIRVSGKPVSVHAPCPRFRQPNPSALTCRATDANQAESGEGVQVCDDLGTLLEVLPADVMEPLMQHPSRNDLLEVILDLGRKPEARFQGMPGQELLQRVVTRADLERAITKLGDFGGDNRAGIEGTLHRISAIRNRKGTVVGLTCRVGRAVTGHVDMIRDILEVPTSLLFLGRPGVGKTTVIRELARTLADDLGKRVVVIDTSNEIGGDGDVPHPAIGSARRMQVSDPANQHRVMIEAVENHMPEVIIVDEIGTSAEGLACRTIAERGVQLIGTAHGQLLVNLMKNPTLSDLVGGIHSVTLGDEEARARNSQKTILERASPPTFPIVFEMRERNLWVAHWVEDSVDALLRNDTPMVQIRRRTNGKVSTEQLPYDAGDLSHLAREAEAGPAADDIFDDTPALGGQYGNALFMGDKAGTVDDPFMWAQRLQDLSDGEALSHLSSRRSSYEMYGGLKKGKERSGSKKRDGAKMRAK